MVNIKDYLVLSDYGKSIKGILTKPEDFIKAYNNIKEFEKASFLNHYLVNNIPYLFQDYPILYEQITRFLAQKLEIHSCEIKLIGSAKTGFSVSPPPDFGKAFSKNSDLDFSIINSKLFYNLEDEFNLWADDYRRKRIKPRNSTEEKYWNEHLHAIPNNQLKNGFIDTNKIPTLNEYRCTQNIQDGLYLIALKLKEYYRIEVTKATARVYKSWSIFTNRIKLNTESVLKKV